MRIKWPLKILILAAVLGAGLAAAGYDLATCKKALLSRCRVNVARLEVQPPRLETLTSGLADGTLTLEITNPYPVAVTLAGAHFTLSTAGKEFGLVKFEGQPVTLAARGSTAVPMRVEVDMAVLLPEVTARVTQSLGEMKLRELGALAAGFSPGKLKEALRDVPLELSAEGEVKLDTLLGGPVTVALKATRGGAAAAAAAPGETRQW
ncbi:MAG: LEA type 2 family protein [Candidatus Wallbacteria bacterium]|nr:LEA type 2 family protein [Candidatus Wallbacteria bacterium]